MKIAVASAGSGGLDDTVSPVFSASFSFTLVDVEDQEILTVAIVENPVSCRLGAAAGGPARDLAGRGVDAVIAGEFGPEEAQVFASAGIGMYRLQNMRVRDAVKQFVNLAADTVRVIGRGIVPTGYANRTPAEVPGLRPPRRPPVT
ncbi:MAG TPA: NifB/NifX family molybdenum-iron cluster-binding protein [Methanoculleus sp.]|nr:NifB/NifX family molybdenum-iron cluster-binding protein [Methanoculleus sp.]